MSAMEIYGRRAPMVLWGASRWAWPIVALIAMILVVRSCERTALRACNAYIQAEQGRQVTVMLWRVK